MKVIEVKEEHIERAIKLAAKKGSNNENCCPVALALQSQGFPKAIVCANNIQLYGASRLGWVSFLPSVKAFVHKFDTDQQVQPFSFELCEIQA